MSYPITVNLDCIKEICEQLSHPQTFEWNSVEYQTLSDGLKRALGFIRADESFEFDCRREMNS